MGTMRTGTVGYSYRDWAGIFYPVGSPPRRQFNTYTQHFDVCELTQFTHQMPDPERMVHFASQIKTDLKLFVRLHNTFTHCADIGLALTVARHFRKAMEPLAEAGRLAGLVAAFPYAFKSSNENRDYIRQLASALDFGEDRPLQLDFRHSSWFSEEAITWLTGQGLGLVCVDEPELPGLVPPLAVVTARRVLVRLHGRNAQGWWSGNAATRYDYRYSAAELEELKARYQPLAAKADEICFLFHNNWQAHSVENAKEWKELWSRETKFSAPVRVSEPDSEIETGNDIRTETAAAAAPDLEPRPVSQLVAEGDTDSLRPPTTLPLAEVKSRVTRALSIVQGSLDLPPRDGG